MDTCIPDMVATTAPCATFHFYDASTRCLPAVQKWPPLPRHLTGRIRPSCGCFSLSKDHTLLYPGAYGPSDKERSTCGACKHSQCSNRTSGFQCIGQACAGGILNLWWLRLCHAQFRFQQSSTHKHWYRVGASRFVACKSFNGISRCFQTRRSQFFR